MACVSRIKIPLYPTLPQAIVDTAGIPLLQGSLDLSLGTFEVSYIVIVNFNWRASFADESCKGLNK